MAAAPRRGATLLLGDFNTRVGDPALAPLAGDYVYAYGSVRDQPDLQPATGGPGTGHPPPPAAAAAAVGHNDRPSNAEPARR